MAIGRGLACNLGRAWATDENPHANKRMGGAAPGKEAPGQGGCAEAAAAAPGQGGAVAACIHGSKGGAAGHWASLGGVPHWSHAPPP